MDRAHLLLLAMVLWRHMCNLTCPMAFHLLGGFHHHQWVLRLLSSYQGMPMESLLILEEDLQADHTVHTTAILPCGADGSHRARHASLAFCYAAHAWVISGSLLDR